MVLMLMMFPSLTIHQGYTSESNGMGHTKTTNYLPDGPSNCPCSHYPGRLPPSLFMMTTTVRLELYMVPVMVIIIIPVSFLLLLFHISQSNTYQANKKKIIICDFTH